MYNHAYIISVLIQKCLNLLNFIVQEFQNKVFTHPILREYASNREEFDSKLHVQ